jgi:putative peptide zinc metalloprotease protein
MYTRDTVIAVRPFTRQPEGEDVIIGAPDSGVFLAIPPEAVEVLDQLQAGKSIGEVSDLYQKRHGEVPDLEDFLALLETKGLVRSTEASAAPAAGPGRASEANPRRYHFSSFPQPLARHIFAKPALTAYFLLVILAAAALCLDPSMLPRSRDLYFPDHRALTWILLLVAYYAALFVHEFAHLVAARAVGVNSRIGLSHRLWVIVAETDLTGIWAVPRRERYLPLLAGMLADAVSAALLILAVFAQHRHWLALPPLAVRLAQAMILSYALNLLWQCFLFVRTDLYYVIANMFNCRNLLGDTEAYLRNQLARILPSVGRVNQAGIPPAERRVIRGYSFIWVAGRIMAVSTLFLVTIPLGIRYFRNLAAAFHSGYAANPSNFLDALVVALLFVIPLSLGFVLWIGGMVRRERI